MLDDSFSSRAKSKVYVLSSSGQPKCLASSACALINNLHLTHSADSADKQVWALVSGTKVNSLPTFYKEFIMAKTSKTKIQSVSKQLATPTDLKAEGAAEIVATLNPLIADSLALYIKTKNFHWHLSGMHFRDLHLMFDEQADQLIASVDPLAERVRKLGGSTLKSIGQIGQTQTLKDDNEEFVTPLEMLRRLLKDNQQMAASQRAAHEVCDDHRDYATSSLLEITIDEAERRIWFLFESIQNVDQSK
jgi:starvation-inducible DNA-binding protein